MHFANPIAFKEALTSGEIRGVDCVITDFNFDDCRENGLDVSNAVCDHYPDMPVFVTTARPIRGAVTMKFDYKMSKEPLKQEELQRLISEIRFAKTNGKPEVGE